MRTTVDIPEELIAEALRVSHAKTKTMAITLGLKELINRKRLDELRSLRGTIDVNLDVRKSRRR
jgi:Arc/MetJ family transcription regulator